MLFAWWAAALASPPAPKLSARSETWNLSAVEFCWPSGLQVHVVRRPGTGVVAVTMVIEGGDSGETEATLGAAHLVEPGRSDPSDAMLIERLARYDLSVGLEEFQHRIGVDTYEWMSPLGFTDLVTGGSQTLDGQLWVLRALQDGRLLDESRHSMLDRIVQLESPAFTTVPWSTSGAFRLGHLAPDHPAGCPWWEVVRAGRSVPEGRVHGLARATFDPSHAHLLLVGPVDPGVVAARAKVVEKWKGRPGERPEVPPLPAVPDRKLFVHPYDSLQTEVHLTCRLPGRGPGTDAGLDVLGAALELGTWQTLREGAGVLADGATHGLTLPDVRGYAGRLAAVDDAALSALLEDCVGHEAVTVIGPDATEALVGLQLGEVERVDWKAFGANLVEALR